MQIETPLPLDKGVVALWCNPPTLQPDHSGGVGPIHDRTPPLNVMTRGRGPDWVCSVSAIPALGTEKRNSTISYPDVLVGIQPHYLVGIQRH